MHTYYPKITGSSSSNSSQYNIVELSTDRVLTSVDNNSFFRVTENINIVIPSNEYEALPLGFRFVLKKSAEKSVSFFSHLNVTIDIQAYKDLSLDALYDAVEIVKEGLNTWGVYGVLKELTYNIPNRLALNVSQTTIDDLGWFRLYKSSDFPQITTTKEYFCLWSTDHQSQINGAILWGEVDDLELNGFQENGIVIKTGTQSEFADLHLIKASESGLANDEIFIYFHHHTNSSPLTQETQLYTTVGGAELHNCTFTNRSPVLSVVSGDDHNGYLRVFKKADSDYVGHHIIKGAGSTPWTNYQVTETSNDGLTFTRGSLFSLDTNMPSGSIWWRHDIYPFTHNGTLYGIVQEITSTVKYFTLVELDVNTYLPSVYVKRITEQRFSDYTFYEKDDIFYLYLRNIDFTSENYPVANSLYLLKIHKEELFI